MKIYNGLTISNVLSSHLKTNASGVVSAAALADFTPIGIAPTISGDPMCGRMTLATGAGVTTADQINATTLYYTPYNGNTISLWNTSTSLWEAISFTEQSITLSTLTASTMYDLFASNNNNGTMSLVATAWTNFTTRATSLTTQNGATVKTGSLGQRHLGSFLLDASKQCQDSFNQRWVWNRYNQVPRKMSAFDASSSSYTLVGAAGGTWAYSHNSSSAVTMSCVVGAVGNPIPIVSQSFFLVPSGAAYGSTGINCSFNAPTTTTAIDSVIRFGGNTTSSMQGGANAYYTYIPTAFGLVVITQLEYAENGTISYFPNGATTNAAFRSGLIATHWC